MISNFFPTLKDDFCVMGRGLQKACGFQKDKKEDAAQRITVAALHMFALLGMAYSSYYVVSTLLAVVTFPLELLSVTLLAIFCRDLFVLTQNASNHNNLSLINLRSHASKEAKKLTNNMAFQPVVRWIYTKPDAE